MKGGVIPLPPLHRLFGSIPLQIADKMTHSSAKTRITSVWPQILLINPGCIHCRLALNISRIAVGMGRKLLNNVSAAFVVESIFFTLFNREHATTRVKPEAEVTGIWNNLSCLLFMMTENRPACKKHPCESAHFVRGCQTSGRVTCTSLLTPLLAGAGAGAGQYHRFNSSELAARANILIRLPVGHQAVLSPDNTF
ncbi:hypothetical protein J6590_000102 [Homalodisca vitripennis]|nr:hypothetical protein J6590_000102 [Homalodisca vitripennis]